MVVLFEFFGREPIENLITCMNFKVDKVVYFGYPEKINSGKQTIENFLKTHCGVNRVVFHCLPRRDLQSILKTMRKEIDNERGKNNDVYFDVTGGESLVLVAFGMMAKELKLPMHTYDVITDEIFELEEGATASISKDIEKRKVPMTLDLMVEMHGGKINKNKSKKIKQNEDPEFEKDIEKIFDVSKRYSSYWNIFSYLLNGCLKPDDKLMVSKKDTAIQKTLDESNFKMKSRKRLNSIINELGNARILTDVNLKDGKTSFRFKSQEIHDCLIDGGIPLEMHTYYRELKKSDDCRVGVHLDWDGILNQSPDEDVLNEIDVLAVKGNIPVFISCKSGKIDKNQALYALYELETVASRFGSGFAEKILVTTQTPSEAAKNRAKEMGITIRAV